MTGCRIVVAILVLVASSLAASAQGSGEPDIKVGEFIPASTPQPAPEMSFDALDGKSLALADFKGKMVVLNLWATWCQPCLKEMPTLEQLEARLGPALVVVAIAEDRGGAEIVRPFLAKLDVDKLTIGLDPKGSAIRALHARGLPTSLVIDADGAVLGKVEGAADWDSDQMVATLMKLMPVNLGR